jgi:hypothetical protein
VGYRSWRIERVVDTLHFAPSSESRLLQAVDLIAFLYHRIATTKAGADMRQVRANRRLWARIERKVWHHHTPAARLRGAQVGIREPCVLDGIESW